MLTRRKMLAASAGLPAMAALPVHAHVPSDPLLAEAIAAVKAALGPPPGPDHPDADLFALEKEIAAAWDESDRLGAELDRLESERPEDAQALETARQAAEAAAERVYRLEERLAATSPKTFAGLRAQIRCMRILWQDSVCGEWGTSETFFTTLNQVLARIERLGPKA